MLLDFDILKVISNDVVPKTGRILISEPLLNDYYFGRSVVLLSEEIDNSFMGFVLNLKSNLFLHNIIDGFSETNIELYLGGPVDEDILYFLHGFGNVKNSHKIADGLYMNGNIEEIKILVNSGLATRENIKFFLGNSGWSPGQLKEEIANNSWLVSDIPQRYIFEDTPDLWSKSLDFVNKRYQVWKNFPMDPEYN
jgi:putative transcriptional regulator